MRSPTLIRRTAIAVVLGFVAVSVAAQTDPAKPKNLKVLDKNMTREEVVEVMETYTRALGVRCDFCHVREAGKPFKREDFQLDDKPNKEKTRIMMRMVDDLNSKYMTQLSKREEPPIKVECATCHHGVAEPRKLQDILIAAYDQGGMDSTTARYNRLRDKYYGRAAYDFGDVPLIDVADHVREKGNAADALALNAMDVELNPNSNYAKRQHSLAAISGGFASSDAAAGATAYADMKAKYGDGVVNEGLLNEAGYDLLGAKQYDAAIATFTFNTTQNPTSGNAFDSLGEAYYEKGDKKKAIESYKKAYALDPKNENAKTQLNALGVKVK